MALTALDANLPSGYTGVAGRWITAQTEPSLAGGKRSLGNRRPADAAARRPNIALRERPWGSRLGGPRALMQLFDLNAPPQIRIWPSWWPRLPFLPLRIQVVQS